MKEGERKTPQLCLLLIKFYESGVNTFGGGQKRFEKSQLLAEGCVVRARTAADCEKKKQKQNAATWMKSKQPLYEPKAPTSPQKEAGNLTARLSAGFILKNLYHQPR